MFLKIKIKGRKKYLKILIQMKLILFNKIMIINNSSPVLVKLINLIQIKKSKKAIITFYIKEIKRNNIII